MNTTESTGITCPHADKQNRNYIMASIGLIIILMMLIPGLKNLGTLDGTGTLVTILGGQGLLLIWAWAAWASEKKHGRKNAYQQGFRDGKTEGERIGEASGKHAYHGVARPVSSLSRDLEYKVRACFVKGTKVWILTELDGAERWHRLEKTTIQDGFAQVPPDKVVSLKVKEGHGGEKIVILRGEPVRPETVRKEAPLPSTATPRKETARISLPPPSKP